jgi:hypothetical protein
MSNPSTLITVNFALPFGYWALVPIFWTVLGLVIAFYMRKKPNDCTVLEHWCSLTGFFAFCWSCTAGSALLARFLP